MNYTVAEISELTSLSKMSIYNRLKLKELEPYLTKKQGVTYISEDGLKVIKDGLNINKDDSINALNDDVNTFKEFKPKDIEEDTTEPQQQDKDFKEDYINHLKLENEHLWNEIQEKNLQIEALQKLVENGQVLLKDKPKQDILQLEAMETHFTELDNKLFNIREQMENRKQEQELKDQGHKGIFQKLFKK